MTQLFERSFTSIMTAGTFRLKGQDLLKLGRKAENAHQVHLKSGVSYPVIYKFIEKPEDVRTVNMANFANFLIKGLGLTPDEIVKMPFGEIFEYVPDEEKID